jgi:hypothetical protein
MARLCGEYEDVQIFSTANMIQLESKNKATRCASYKSSRIAFLRQRTDNRGKLSVFLNMFASHIR